MTVQRVAELLLNFILAALSMVYPYMRCRASAGTSPFKADGLKLKAVDPRIVVLGSISYPEILC